MTKPLLDFSECLILTTLKEHQSLSSLAIALNMDKGQLSRKLSKISETAPVLIKIHGRWALTDQGDQLVEWYKGSLVKQSNIFSRKRELSIVTSQPVSERIVTPLVSTIKDTTGFESIRIMTNLSTIETDILAGKIDIALTCSIPESPEIRYKKIFKSPYVIVLPNQWKEKINGLSHLLQFPYVTHTAIDLRQLLNLEETIPYASTKYDHVSGVREGVINHHGWAILPKYTVENELKENKLKLFHNPTKLVASEEFQLWWLPGKMENKVALKLAALFNH